jgi:hypothetical protein
VRQGGIRAWDMLRVMEGGVADEVKFQIGEVADEVGLSLRTIRH